MVEREDWSNNASSPDAEYKTVEDVGKRLHVAVAESMRLIVISSTEESVEFNFPYGYAISLHDRSLRCIRVQGSAGSQPRWVFYC